MLTIRLEMRMVVRKKMMRETARTLLRSQLLVTSHSTTVKMHTGARTKTSTGTGPTGS